MILRLDADFSGMGGVKAEQLAMTTLYRHLSKLANDYLPEYGGASLTLIVGYEDTRDEGPLPYIPRNCGDYRLDTPWGRNR